MACKARLLSGLLLGFVGLGGCFDPPDIPEGLECSRFDDCPPTQDCFDGFCFVDDPVDAGQSALESVSSQVEEDSLQPVDEDPR
jgi:hypothetical protein